MVRLSKDDLLAAWKALDRSQIDEQPGAQGWRGIRLFTHQGCSFHAGRRQPDNEEMLIAVFPHPLSPGSTALPSCKGFRVEMAGTEEGRQNGLMIRRQQTGNADVFTTMILDILHSFLNRVCLKPCSVGFVYGRRLWSAIPVHSVMKKKWG